MSTNTYRNFSDCLYTIYLEQIESGGGAWTDTANQIGELYFAAINTTVDMSFVTLSTYTMGRFASVMTQGAYNTGYTPYSPDAISSVLYGSIVSSACVKHSISVTVSNPNATVKVIRAAVVYKSTGFPPPINANEEWDGSGTLLAGSVQSITLGASPNSQIMTLSFLHKPTAGCTYTLFFANTTTATSSIRIVNINWSMIPIS